MKLRRLLFTFLLSLAAFQFCFSQENEKKSILLASVVEPTYEEISAQTDYFATEVYKLPNAIGYIVVYGGSNQIENFFYKRAAVRNIRFRKYDEKKLKVINSTKSEKIKFEFWLSKDGTEPPVKQENNDFIISNRNEAFFFADDLVELTKIDGKQSYYSVGCDAGCIRYLDFNLLSEFLNKNPQLKAFMIIRGKNLKKAKLTKTIFSNEVLVGSEFPLNKLYFLYGGKNKANNNQFSEIEVYLALDESQLPKLPLTKYKPL